MNLYFVYDDGQIVTPELTGTILEGVTRDSIITLASELGHKVDERRVSIEEWRSGVESGQIVEVFACGTAAVIAPVGHVKSRSGEWSNGDGGAGTVTMRLRAELLELQYGRRADPHGWMRRVGS